MLLKKIRNKYVYGMLKTYVLFVSYVESKHIVALEGMEETNHQQYNISPIKLGIVGFQYGCI